MGFNQSSGWRNLDEFFGIANQVEERYACSFCLASLPPYEVHPDTGTTFWQDCEELEIILHYELYPPVIVIYCYMGYIVSIMDYTTLNKLRPRKAIPPNKHRPKGVALPYTWATKKQAATQISANIDLQNPAMLAIMIQNMEKWRHDSLIEMHLHTCTLQRNSCEDHKRRPDHLIHTWCLGAFGIVQGFTANFN